MKNKIKSFLERFTKGETIYYVHDLVNDKKEIKELKVQTIYPQVLIGVEDRGMSQCIDISEWDRIFPDEYGAKRYLEGEDGT